MDIFKKMKTNIRQAKQLLQEMMDEARDLNIENLQRRGFILKKGVSPQELDSYLFGEVISKQKGKEILKQKGVVPHCQKLIKDSSDQFAKMVEINAMLIEYMELHGWTQEYNRL